MNKINSAVVCFSSKSLIQRALAYCARVHSKFEFEYRVLCAEIIMTLCISILRHCTKDFHCGLRKTWRVLF
jgi:hypothetical protein